MTVELKYGVTFGKGDSSDWCDWEIELTPEEEIAYNNAVENEIPLDEVEELRDALRRAYEEIEDQEINNGLDLQDAYIMECQGKADMDTDELNELVHNKDPYALEFFALTNASDEEIEEWDAEDLDEVPTIEEFVKEFEPYSPFDEGYSLHIEFAVPNDDYSY